jgi:hypothetical protein
MPIDSSYLENDILLTNAAATGSAVPIKGGTYVWGVEGTFGGTTATLQLANANGTFVNFPNASLTANGFAVVSLPVNGSVRVALTSGTPSAMFSNLVSVP